ncbi:MAG: ribosome biogenesis GTP-binding protein YsxC [Acidobacteria bacterium]|nr:ribosome biogenesis GTP-binding protein YsxC [Acidobacteriota bacterium]
MPLLPNPLNVAAEFVTSAADATGFPNDRLPEVALVGRSNVGKSSLINAVTRRHIARTSAAPGKTRLANFYRMARGGDAPMYLVDLPGYGYARGKARAAAAFDVLVRSYFDRGKAAAILLIDSRHPGLASDRAAWHWIRAAAIHAALVATKMDKLSHGERIRAMRTLESVFEDSVLPVSAVTGEGLDELCKLINRLANNPQPTRNSSRSRPPKATAPLPPKR